MHRTAQLVVLPFLVLATGCARDLTVPDGLTGGASSASTVTGGAAAAVADGSAGATTGTTTTDTSGTTAGATTGGTSAGGTTGGTTTAGPTTGATTSGTGSGSTTGGSTVVAAPPAPEFRGDDSPMPAFGGWAWGGVPADSVAKAGFDWFEIGYPGDSNVNAILRNARVRPFAYINLGELDPVLASQANYTGAILRSNGDWGTQLVDVTDPSWQAWLIRRADYAYGTGSRGVKWDVATPDIPPGKTRADVNAAIASIMQQILQQHPDFKFIFNQGFEFALAYPQYVHGMETEGLFSASSYPAAYLQPWLDPFYWGPQYQQLKAVHQNGAAIFVAEYADPSSDQARQLYGAIVAQGFVPYITNEQWNVRGLGYNVAAGW